MPIKHNKQLLRKWSVIVIFNHDNRNYKFKASLLNAS